MTPLFLDGEGRLRSGWKAFLFLVGLSFASGLTYLLLVELLGLKGLAQGPLGETIPTLIVLLLSALATRLEGRPWTSLGLRMDLRWGLELGLGLLIGAAVMAMTALTLRAAGGFTWVPNPAATGRALLSGAWVFLFVAINEEATFRGYPFQRLCEGLGPWGAQFLFALFFAGVHLSNPGIRSAGLALKTVTTLNIALAALLLGLAYLRTRSLALPIGIHWAWNFTQGNLLGFPVSGTGYPTAPLKPILSSRPDWLTGGPVGLEGSLLCSLLCLGCIALLYFWRGTRPQEA